MSDDTQAANRLDTIDKKLLRITSAKPFKRLLERERAKARRKTKSEMRENYDKRTARQKIRSELKSLRKMIREQSKEKNVKRDVLPSVEAAINVLEQMISGDPATMTNAEVVDAGLTVRLTEAENNAYSLYKTVLPLIYKMMLYGRMYISAHCSGLRTITTN